MNQRSKLMPRHHWNFGIPSFSWAGRSGCTGQDRSVDPEQPGGRAGLSAGTRAFRNQTNSLSDSLCNFRAGHLTPSGCFCHLLADGWWCKIKKFPCKGYYWEEQGEKQEPTRLSLLGGALQKYHAWWAECLQESQITAVRMDYKSRVKPSRFYKWYISFITDPLLLLFSHTHLSLSIFGSWAQGVSCCINIPLCSFSTSPIFFPSCIKKFDFFI